MNKRLEINSFDGSLKYDGNGLHNNQQARTQLWKDFTAMQSELESLRPKCKALDWLEKHAGKHVHILRNSSGEIIVFHNPPVQAESVGQNLLAAMQKIIALYGTDEIPDKGDTMETIPPSEIRNVLEIRDVAKNIVALFFDGERCSGDHRSESAFGKTYTKLVSYVASLESCLAEAQALLEEKDKTEHDLKIVSESLLKYEHRVAELEPLADAVNSVERHKLRAHYYPQNPPSRQWIIQNDNSNEGSGETIEDAFADYCEKHPEPEEISNEQWNKRYVEAIKLLGEALEFLDKARADLYPRPAIAGKIGAFLVRKESGR